MEQITAIVTGACLLSLAVGVVHMIRPSKAFEQQVRFLVSMLFIVCITKPFLTLEMPGFSSITDTAEAAVQCDTLADETQTQVLAATRMQTEHAVAQYLTANGITCTQVTAIMNIDGTGSISISEVSVMCSPPETAAALLQSVLGEGVTLHVAEASA